MRQQSAGRIKDVHAGLPAIASGRPVVWFTSGISEVSRFSCMEFPDVLGVYDYAGPARNSRYRSWSCCLPLQMTASAPRLQLFEAQYPTRLSPCLRFRGSFTGPTAKLGAE